MRTRTALFVSAIITIPTFAGAGPSREDTAQTQEAERVREVVAEARQLAEASRADAEMARQQAALARQQADVLRQDAERARLSIQGPVAVAAPTPFRLASIDTSTYSSAHNALQQRQYERAISQFDRVIAQKAARADAALYWRAFAQHRLGQPDPALASLAELRRDFGQSRYLADARALEAEVKRAGNRPAGADDDEIKLLAIQGVQRSADAVPVLEGVLTSVNSLAVKRRALSALAAIEDPRARTTLQNYAKGSGNLDLQVEAIRQIASRKGTPIGDADLRAMYASATDVSVKTAVISALASQENADALVALARSETDLDLKREIVRRISDLAPRSKPAADFLTGVLK